MSAMSWLLGWIMFFMLLYLLSRSRAGNTVIYYVTWLLVVLLLVTHATQVTNVLKGTNNGTST